jgi:hypothetical protein
VLEDDVADPVDHLVVEVAEGGQAERRLVDLLGDRQRPGQ